MNKIFPLGGTLKQKAGTYETYRHSYFKARGKLPEYIPGIMKLPP